MNQRQKKILIEGVLKAGKSILHNFYQNPDKSLKQIKVASFDYGIEADLQAETIILAAIEKSKLDCLIVSEETGIIGDRKADYLIVTDPLDGTVNFSRGIPHFCVALAVFCQKEPILSVVYDPSVKELIVAQKNQGVIVNNRKITIRKSAFQQLLVNLEWFGAKNYNKISRKLKSAQIRARHAGSGVLAGCYACINRGDMTILLDDKPWDIAPCLCMAEEQNLIVKNIDGSNYILSVETLKNNVIIGKKAMVNKLLPIIN